MDHDTQPPQAEDPPRSRSRSPTSHQSQYRHRSPDTRRDDTEENAARRDREDMFLEEKILELAKETVYIYKRAVFLAEQRIAELDIEILKAQQEMRTSEHDLRTAEWELQLLKAKIERRRARREQDS